MVNGFSMHAGMGSRRHGFGFWRIAGLTLAGIVFAVVLAFVFGIFVQMLWNWLMPQVFHLGTITFWQAFGLIILAKLFFGSFGPQHHHGRHGKWRRQQWKHGCQEMADDGINRDEWRHYDQFWQDEGRAAFKAYIERMRNDKAPSPPSE